MPESTVSSSTTATSSRSKKTTKATAGATQKSKPGPAHPTVAEMVNAAIKAIKGRNGASAYAIKKYIAGKYLVEIEKLAHFIRKYLNKAVVKGVLIQASGKGASGRFKWNKTYSADGKPKAPEKVEKAAEMKSKNKKPIAAEKVRETKVSRAVQNSSKKTKVEKKSKASKAAKPKIPLKKAQSAKKAPSKKASKN